MKAVVVKNVGVIELQDIPEPEPAPDQIKVKIAYSGICGSDPINVKGGLDITPYQKGSIGWLQKPLPRGDGVHVLGHEASGTIVKIGKDIKGDFKIGQHVAMNFWNTCGICYYCTRGSYFCEGFISNSGAMAEYALYREESIYPLPDNVPLDAGAFLEPTAIAVHAVENAHIKLGDSVLITGGGPIGLLIMQLVIKSGASNVLVSTRTAEKRKLAKQLGADVVVDPIHEDLLAITKEFTDGRGFSVSFETSGSLSVARQLILLAESAGTVVWVATYQGNLDVGVPISYVHAKEITIRNVVPSPYSFRSALQMLPKLDLKPMITVYPLQDAIKAFEAQSTGKFSKILLKL